jgi:hypothetical protein
LKHNLEEVTTDGVQWMIRESFGRFGADETYFSFLDIDYCMPE